jgi:hypothetical protein
MRVSYRGAIRCGLATLAGATLLCAAPPTHLQVLSTTLNPSTHQVTVELVNSTNDKTVVAYILETKSFDAAGKQVDDSGVGWDFMGPEPNPEARKYILPVRTASAVAYAPAAAVSVQVLVTSVVYLDRTFEGPTPDLIFGARSRQAKVARQAITVLKSYPQTPEDTRKTMQALITIGSPLVNGVLTNKLHLRSMPDSTHPPVEESFSKQQWEDVRTELEQRAAFFEAQSQGVKR